VKVIHFQQAHETVKGALLILCALTRLAGFGQTPVWTQFPNSPGPSTQRHDDIYFTDATNGWATQNNNLYRTTNGGVSWETNLTLSGTHFRSLGFLTPQIGFAGNLGVGSYDGGVSNTNIIYRTVDGGITWSNVPGFAEAGMKGMCAFHVLDSQTIYGVGRVRGPAHFIKSADAGTNWTLVNLTAQGVMNGLMDVYFRDTNTGWVVGMDTNAYSSPPYYGRIARTDDGGASWTPQVTTTIANCYFWKMSWPSTNIGYVALQQNGAYDTIVFYKTTDGGNNWVSNGIPLSTVGNPPSFYLQGMGFVSPNEGWMGGANNIGYASSFLRTTNGGATWFPVGYDNTYLLNRIRFNRPTFGYASGRNLHLYAVPLTVTTQPESQVVVGPTNVSLSVEAAGHPAPVYQWRKDSADIAGATAPSLTLTNVLRTDAGTYSVFVSNAWASATSSNAILQILVPSRLSQPRIIPGEGIQLLFDDADGGALLTTNDLAGFTVQASTNLMDWIDTTSQLVLTNGSVLFVDSLTNQPRRFYRVLEQFEAQ
jgi:photosystem II stability/assembly factor-like uncharacterized protein